MPIVYAPQHCFEKSLSPFRLRRNGRPRLDFFSTALLRFAKLLLVELDAFADCF